MNKKIIFIGIGIIFLIAGFLFWLLKPFSSSQTKTLPSPSSKRTVRINILPLGKRPYVILEPKSSIEPKSLGHWATLTIDKTASFEKVEYEFEYTTGSMIQGGIGRIDFGKEKPPVSKEIAFGSASKGKYKYDEGVYEGKFTFRFLKGGEEEVLRTEFNLQNYGETKGIFDSPDKKVKLDVGENLESTDYVIIASTLGLPGKVEGEVLAGPYGFYTDSQRKLTNAVLTFDGVEKDDVVILGWQGSSWQEYKTEVSGGKASTEVSSLGTFVLVAK